MSRRTSTTRSVRWAAPAPGRPTRSPRRGRASSSARSSWRSCTAAGGRARTDRRDRVRSALGEPAVGDLQVVAPVTRRLGDLPQALEAVVPEGGGEALGERGVVAPLTQDAAV